MTFTIDLSDGNFNCTIKRNTSDKNPIIILQSIQKRLTLKAVFSM